MVDQACRLMVLNYNGIQLLKENLPGWIEAAANCNVMQVKVSVLDNNSTDGSVHWLKEQSGIHVHESDNAYLFTYNQFVPQVNEDYLIFLNNDMFLYPDTIDILLDTLLEYPQAFSISGKIWRPKKNQLDMACVWGEFRRGLLHHESWTPETVNYSMFSSGGCFACTKEKFLKLGGFNSIYYPAYWEDSDLCYHAWRKGWANYYQPKAEMIHQGSYSWSKSGSSHINYLKLRNSILFSWVNVKSKKILTQSIYWASRYYLSGLKRKDRVVVKAIRDAFSLLAKAKSIRRIEINEYTDDYICNICNHRGYQ